jgi:immunity protein 52 of polymorphic toxin system
MEKTTPEVFYLRAFWGARHTTFEEGAERLLKFLSSLARMEPTYGLWYPLGQDSDDPRAQPVSIERSALEAHCRKGIFRTSVRPYSPIPDLGFSFSLATGGKWRLSLRVHCGCISSQVNNSLLMDLPYSSAAGRRTLRVGFLLPLCRLVAECWDPDVAQVRSLPISQAFPAAEGGIEVGWLTFVSDRLRNTPDLEPAFGIERVEGRGWIILASQQKFSSGNVHHVDRLKRVERALNGALRQPGG